MQDKPIIIQPDREYYWLAFWYFDPTLVIPPLLLWFIIPSHFRATLVTQGNWLLLAIPFIMISMLNYLLLDFLCERIPLLRPILFIIRPIQAIYSSKNLIMIKWGVPLLTTIIKRNIIYSCYIEKVQKSFVNKYVDLKGNMLILQGKSQNEIAYINLWGYSSDKVSTIIAALKPIMGELNNVRDY